MKAPPPGQDSLDDLSREELRAYVADLEGRLEGLLRVVAKVAAGDFSEKPAILEREDVLSQFAVGFRFMVEDLERAQTEDRKRTQELLEANERLRGLNDLRAQFINNAAHELNTPLTPLRTELYILRQALAAAEFAEHQESMQLLERNVERLQHLVHDLLESARLQSHHYQLERQPQDAAEVAMEAVDAFRANARAAGIHLEVRFEKGLTVEADPRRIVQVLSNLLSNSMKFTPAGGRIHVSSHRVPGGVELRVRDTGQGLTEEQRSRLFQPFTQVHDQRSGPRGNGLGLYISRGIMEIHGGNLWCESRGPGKGTTFVAWLPAVGREVPDSEEAVTATPRPAAAEGSDGPSGTR